MEEVTIRPRVPVLMSRQWQALAEQDHRLWRRRKLIPRPSTLRTPRFICLSILWHLFLRQELQITVTP